MNTGKFTNAELILIIDHANDCQRSADHYEALQLAATLAACALARRILGEN